MFTWQISKFNSGLGGIWAALNTTEPTLKGSNMVKEPTENVQIQHHWVAIGLAQIAPMRWYG